ncbi:BTF3b-like transcription factor, partial [Reticulomyxa filosa]
MLSSCFIVIASLLFPYFEKYGMTKFSNLFFGNMITVYRKTCQRFNKVFVQLLNIIFLQKNMPLNQAEVQERLKQKFGDRSARTGGKGAARRKYKAVAKTATQDDKRLNAQLKRLSVTQIPAIEEVNLFKDDGTVVHFVKPKVQAEISSNTYVVQGNHDTKKLEELFPDILPQLGIESMQNLKVFFKTDKQTKKKKKKNANNLAQLLKHSNFGADEVPKLVSENFEEVAKSDEKAEEKNAATATTSTESAPASSSAPEDTTK